ncbi:rhodanese-like domain-containing protein [Rubrivirga litoralis]|uniref:Rhodanese-like domain-containing protein n=1 Tax=Rubrivirga litoralis TaxID=3075598 RepID=A0ABU3BUT9_9BACT|nr:rhodanese-like domain-containing protein [Rubrivirga sp. F394]MDT0633062.1 rhodanese-like domain-containing protein [Rubrivirga sp. F394]
MLYALLCVSLFAAPGGADHAPEPPRPGATVTAAPPADSVDVARLSPEEAAAFLAETPDAVVVDVRTPAEVAASGRLAGAIVLDVTAPGFETRALNALDLDRPLLVYCRSGTRAERAARRLAVLGASRLANAGGFDALAAAGLATEPYTP